MPGGGPLRAELSEAIEAQDDERISAIEALRVLQEVAHEVDVAITSGSSVTSHLAAKQPATVPPTAKPHPRLPRAQGIPPTSLLPRPPPAQPKHQVENFKTLFERLYTENCALRDDRSWVVQSMQHQLPDGDYNWQQRLGHQYPPGGQVMSAVATFFPAEADHNRGGAPRLDVLLIFSDGITVRYHPHAKLIWSTDAQPTEAMQKRMNLARKQARRRNS